MQMRLPGCGGKNSFFGFDIILVTKILVFFRIVFYVNEEDNYLVFRKEPLRFWGGD